MNWNDVKENLESGAGFVKIPDGVEILPVVGLTFVPGYPENILNIRTVLAYEDKAPSVKLIRNPQNPYDANAIEVHFIGAMVGHLSKDVAARLAPLMDAGREFDANIYQVRVSPDNPKNPGLDVVVRWY